MRTYTGLSVVSRVLLSAIFLISGLSKIPNWDATLGYMTNQGIVSPEFFLACAIAIEVLCGASILLNIKARWGAAILCAYLVPVTLIFHNFWSLTGADFQMQMVQFLKNLTIIAGLHPS